MVVVINAGGVPAKTLVSLPTASLHLCNLDRQGGSSDSSSDSSGRGGGGPGSPQGPPDYGGPLSPHAHAMSVGSNVLGFTSEKDVYCSKDLSLIKIDSLPASAAEFRSWKNTILTRIAAIDQTGSDVVLSWLLGCFTEGLQLQDFMHSGLLHVWTCASVRS